MNQRKCSHAYLIALLSTVPLRAAVIRGVVVDALANRPLARAPATHACAPTRSAIETI